MSALVSSVPAAPRVWIVWWSLAPRQAAMDGVYATENAASERANALSDAFDAAGAAADVWTEEAQVRS